ncbi:winged helix-turn-helix domain-containing protein [Galbitalea sp. SE-J8]|uniref:ArsR/SmtB family transcription factor n=1 Tax=Galbitalea sp. SE-J8 TaxID=3054952 RepID=UPI00259CA4BC|nr:winged helix-turn-helix domain-containing protein [Galbitalea sp. SE-J8]MDM4763807.1 winged helix-turn-helix domain-containing protein [Galbitalea sp. SE-J8]
MDVDELSARLTAIASTQRLRILAELAGGAVHVSELARRVGMSRALLYMHLTRLEESGYVTGRLELGPDGKALKLFDLEPFEVTVDIRSILAAVAVSPTPPSREQD